MAGAAAAGATAAAAAAAAPAAVTRLNRHAFAAAISRALEEFLASGEADVPAFVHRIDADVLLEGDDGSGEVARREVARAVVRTALGTTERKRERLACLLSSLHVRGILSASSIGWALATALHRLPEYGAAAPRALAGLMVHLVQDDVVSDAFVLHLGADAHDAAARALHEAVRDAAVATLEQETPTPLAQARSMFRELVWRYYATRDFEQLTEEVEALGAPHSLHELVRKIVQVALDGDAARCEVGSCLLARCVATDLVPVAAVCEGFLRTLRTVHELAIDRPAAPSLVAAFIARAIDDGACPAEFADEIPEFLARPADEGAAPPASSTPAAPPRLVKSCSVLGSKAAVSPPSNMLGHRTAVRMADGTWSCGGDSETAAGGGSVTSGRSPSGHSPASAASAAMAGAAGVSDAAGGIPPAPPSLTPMHSLSSAPSSPPSAAAMRVLSTSDFAKSSMAVAELRRLLSLPAAERARVTHWGFPQRYTAIVAEARAIAREAARLWPAPGSSPAAASTRMGSLGAPALRSTSDEARDAVFRRVAALPPPFRGEVVAVLLAEELGNLRPTEATLATGRMSLSSAPSYTQVAQVLVALWDQRLVSGEGAVEALWRGLDAIFRRAPQRLPHGICVLAHLAHRNIIDAATCWEERPRAFFVDDDDTGGGLEDMPHFSLGAAAAGGSPSAAAPAAGGVGDDDDDFRLDADDGDVPMAGTASAAGAGPSSRSTGSGDLLDCFDSLLDCVGACREAFDAVLARLDAMSPPTAPSGAAVGGAGTR